jgi:hypothetical protein
LRLRSHFRKSLAILKHHCGNFYYFESRERQLSIVNHAASSTKQNHNKASALASRPQLGFNNSAAHPPTGFHQEKEK